MTPGDLTEFVAACSYGGTENVDHFFPLDSGAAAAESVGLVMRGALGLAVFGAADVLLSSGFSV